MRSAIAYIRVSKPRQAAVALAWKPQQAVYSSGLCASFASTRNFTPLLFYQFYNTYMTT